MEKIGRQVLLYDFYGELLTEHQRSVYEDIVLNDLSLGEIAAERGISRQGVHDIVKRCDRILTSYEERLHLVERFVKTRDDVMRICELSAVVPDDGIAAIQFSAGEADGIPACNWESSGAQASVLREIHRLSEQILEEL